MRYSCVGGPWATESAQCAAWPWAKWAALHIDYGGRERANTLTANKVSECMDSASLRLNV